MFFDDDKEKKVDLNNEENVDDSNLQNNSIQDNQEEIINKLKDDIARLNLENDSLRIQIKELNENYKKQVIEKAIQAEKMLNENIDKLKERYKNEFDIKQKYAIEKDAIKLIDVINNFDMALKHSPSDPQVKNYVTGFKMILSMFHNLLDDLNIKEITINLGDEFNHDYMEVLEQIPSDIYKTNQVIEILKPAYKLHDHVISFAKVRVAK